MTGYQIKYRENLVLLSRGTLVNLSQYRTNHNKTIEKNKKI